MKTKIIALFTALAVALSCGAVAFGAEQDMKPFDFWEYGTYISEDGDWTIYSFLFEPSVYDPYCSWYSENADEVHAGTGTTVTVPLLEDDTTYIEFEPFGTYGYYFPTQYVPAGTEVYGELYANMNFSHDSYPPYTLGVYYVSADGGILDYESYDGNTFDSAFTFGFATKGVPGAVGFFLSFSVEVGTLYDGRGMMELEDFTLEMRINNQAMSNNWDKTIADKIDQIINGYDPKPDDPGGGIGEDLDDAEDELMDGAQQGLQDFTTHTQGFLAWLTGSATAFAAAGALLGVILEVQIYNDLLYASLILGSFALFLGAAITIFKRRE